jgi:hypothetical protein
VRPPSFPYTRTGGGGGSGFHTGAGLVQANSRSSLAYFAVFFTDPVSIFECYSNRRVKPFVYLGADRTTVEG